MNKGSLTLEQALEELNQLLKNLDKICVSDLESIVSRLSIVNAETSVGAITYLYSGRIESDSSNFLVKEIAQQQGTVAKIIDFTPAAKFLENQDYEIALRAALQNENTDLKSDITKLNSAVTNYMYDKEVESWAKTSIGME